MKTNTLKIFPCVLAAAVCLGYTGQAQAFWTDGGQSGGALEQLGIAADVKGEEIAADVKDTEMALPQPERVAPVATAVQRDIFTEIQACKALDRTFIMRPTTEDALKMLAPCMKGVSKLYGNKVYAESTIMNPDNLQIVVLDSVAGKTIVEDLKAAIAKRDGGLFGYKVELAVMDVSYKAVQRTETFRVKAQMLDMESSVEPQAQLLVPGTAAEFTVTIRGDHRSYAHEILLTLHKAEGNLYQVEADASQSGYRCKVAPSRQFVEPGSEITVMIEPEHGFRSQYRMRLSVSRATAPIEFLSDEYLQNMLDEDKKDLEKIQKKADETKKKLRELE